MSSHKPRPKWRLWLALILLILALGLLVFSLLPQMRFQQVLPMPPVVLPTPTSLILSWGRV